MMDFKVDTVDTLPRRYSDKVTHSPYMKIYKIIDERVTAEKWLVLRDFQDFGSAHKLYGRIRANYRGYIVKFHKFDELGNVNPQIYIRRRMAGAENRNDVI